MCRQNTADCGLAVADGVAHLTSRAARVSKRSALGGIAPLWLRLGMLGAVALAAVSAHAAAPTIGSVSPNAGNATGGTSVTITGTDFVSGATVTFGGTGATGVNVVSSTQLTCSTPAHTAGAVDVVVTTAGGSATSAGAFTYWELAAGGIGWGDNSSCQVRDQYDLRQVVAIAAAYGHTVALRNDGSVLAWGDNDYNQCTVPAGAQSGVTAIAAGWYQTVALKCDGSVLAWGNNDSGECIVPAEMQSRATAIAAGYHYVVALLRSKIPATVTLGSLTQVANGKPRYLTSSTAPVLPPDLAGVVKAWPGLPAHIRAAILALVGVKP